MVTFPKYPHVLQLEDKLKIPPAGHALKFSQILQKPQNAFNYSDCRIRKWIDFDYRI
jgi:hypothetical protein